MSSRGGSAARSVPRRLDVVEGELQGPRGELVDKMERGHAGGTRRAKFRGDERRVGSCREAGAEEGTGRDCLTGPT